MIEDKNFFVKSEVVSSVKIKGADESGVGKRDAGVGLCGLMCGESVVELLVFKKISGKCF